MILDDTLCVFYTHCCQCLSEIGNRYSLDAEYIIGVEESLEIFCLQELTLRETVDRLGLRVVISNTLDALQTLNDVLLGVRWAVMKHSGQQLLHKHMKIRAEFQTGFFYLH